jgi:hypothetical protein
MSQFISSGRIIDLVLLLVALEIAVLLLYRPGREKSSSTADVLAHLWAAAGLLSAAHLLIAHSWWVYVGLALSAALIAHILALRARWRSPPALRMVRQ